MTSREALKQMNFSLPAGRFAALLGPNGAGKSTLIALLTRLYDLQRGEIRIGGHSLQKSPRSALRQLGVVFQQSTLDLDLSIEQNLRYHLALHGFSRRQGSARIDAELTRQHLTERRHERVRDLQRWPSSPGRDRPRPAPRTAPVAARRTQRRP